jgi:hypothetical protein
MCGAELKGHPFGVFKLQPDDLTHLTGAAMVDVAELGVP